MKKFTLLMLTVLCGLLITSCKNELATEKSSEDFVTVTLNLNGNARNISPCNAIDNKKVKITKVEFVNTNNPEKSITYTKDIGETYSIRPGVYAVKVYGVYSLEGRNQEIEDGIEIQEGSSQTSSNLMEAKVFGETEPFSIENDMDISVMISLTKEGTGGFYFEFVVPNDYKYQNNLLVLRPLNGDECLEFETTYEYYSDEVYYCDFEYEDVKSGIYSLEFYGTTDIERLLFDFPCELIEIADDLTVANTFELDESVINERIGSTTLYATTGLSKGNGFFSEFPANVNDIFAIVEGYTTKERGIDVEVYKENPDDEIIFDAAKVKSSKRIYFDIEKDSIIGTYYFIDNAFEVWNGSFDFVIDNSNGFKNPTGMNIKMGSETQLNVIIRKGAFVNVDVTEAEFEKSSSDGFMKGRININFSKIEDFLGYYNNHNKIAVIKTNNEIEYGTFSSCFDVYVDSEELAEAGIMYNVVYNKTKETEDGYLYEVYLEEAH